MTMHKLTADEFARMVYTEMARLRGWNPARVPVGVRDDIFATMGRHDNLYAPGFRDGSDPRDVARDVQEAEWDDLDANACRCESVTTPDGHGAYCRYCGETLA